MRKKIAAAGIDLFKACERADEEVNESNLEDFISDELDKF